jgi:hypothetical protein
MPMETNKPLNEECSSDAKIYTIALLALAAGGSALVMLNAQINIYLALSFVFFIIVILTTLLTLCGGNSSCQKSAALCTSMRRILHLLALISFFIGSGLLSYNVLLLSTIEQPVSSVRALPPPIMCNSHKLMYKNGKKVAPDAIDKEKAKDKTKENAVEVPVT